jgi:hypothetical protein
MSTQVQQDWDKRVLRLRHVCDQLLLLVEELDKDDECHMSGADVVEFICNMRLGISEAHETAHDPLLGAANELLEAADEVLSNVCDSKCYGPEDVDPDDWDGPLDEDGDMWFWDMWNLRTALDKGKGWKP